MSNQFSSGKHSIAECDVCGFRYKLTKLKPLIIKGKQVNILACPTCWTPDQPQLMLGSFPVFDPQAVRQPRPDQSYWQSGETGLQVDIYPPNNTELGFGGPPWAVEIILGGGILLGLITLLLVTILRIRCWLLAPSELLLLRCRKHENVHCLQ